MFLYKFNASSLGLGFANSYFCSMIGQNKIERANVADVEALNSLVNSAYRGEGSKNGWTTEAEILDGIRIDVAALTKILAKDDVVVLKCTNGEGNIVGTVCLELKPGYLHLGMFAVSPDLQGGGIGKSLMKAAEEFGIANSCDRIIISVISSRTELIDWYKRHGYLATGSDIAFEDIDGRFGDPKVDGIRLIEMEKQLEVS